MDARRHDSLVEDISATRPGFFHVGASVDRDNAAGAAHVEELIRPFRECCIGYEFDCGNVCASQFVVKLFTGWLQAGIHVAVRPFNHPRICRYAMRARFVARAVPPPDIQVFHGSCQTGAIENLSACARLGDRIRRFCMQIP